MTFADTNWLEAMFFAAADASETGRRGIVQRFMRHQGGLLGLSHLVYLEARHVFTRISSRCRPG